MNNFLQIFMSGEQFFKSYSEVQDFLFPIPKSQTACENLAFQTKHSPIASSCFSCQASWHTHIQSVNQNRKGKGYIKVGHLKWI